MPTNPSNDRGPYHLTGAAARLFSCQAPEVVLSGPAGTGKSLACLLKLHYLCDQVPRLRAVMLRKTRVSLTESALVTFEERVVPAGHAILEGSGRANRQAYHYPNGSTIVCGGLDKPGKIFSTEYDLAYCQEAIEFSEEAWEALSTRMRNGVLPYQQIMADTNPDSPIHWLKKRSEEHKCLMLESRHEDNPLLWDGRSWTPFGAAYISKLDALTGARKLRLRYGRWVQAEGVVYDGWDRAVHLVDPFPIPPDWPRWWSVDFGYVDPFVCQFWTRDPEGRLYLYRELYRSQRLVEDLAKELLQLLDRERQGARQWTLRRWREDEERYPAGDRERELTRRLQAAERAVSPKAVVCDHDREGRETLAKHLRMPTTAARKEISPGIQAVQARLRPGPDGKPRLMVFKDALVSRDPILADKKLPTCLEAEIDGYVWDTDGGRKHGEEPVDLNNHSMDAMRYLVFWLDGPRKTMRVWT